MCVCALHFALLAPTVGSWSSILDGDFGPEAEAIEDGDRPYDDQELEYPPLSIPLIVGPALPGEGIDDYAEAFQWEMIGFDLAIVLVLALALPGDQRRVLGALGVYTVGIVALSGIVLADSLIDEAPLALGRFDLVPALLVLAAVLARERGRSAGWSALLATGAAVKAFPLLLFPALLKGERHLGRAAVAATIPLLVALAVVIAWGDHFSSAVTYHTDRDLQVETIAATPFVLASEFGGEVYTVPTSGSWNLVATGTDLTRLLSLTAMVSGLPGGAPGWLVAPGRLASLVDRAARRVRRPLPGALAAVPVVAAAALRCRFRPRTGEPGVARSAGADRAVASPLRRCDRRPRRRLRLADRRPQRAAPRLSRPRLRADLPRPRLERMARGEFDLIAAITERLPATGPRLRVASGDDAAVVEPGDRATAVTVDAIVEGVHFSLPEFPPEAVGRKALATALSDLAAMGAAPGEAYVVLGAPLEAEDETLLALADGIAAVAGRDDVSVAGGDLVAAPQLFLAVTAVGYEREAPLVRRAGARPGDLVAVTGELGGAAAALELLTGGVKAEGISPERREALIARQLDPRPRVAAGQALASAGATSMIDLSDGLGADAGHLADAGGHRIEVDLDRLPLAEGVAEVARRGGAVELAALGGEDFELLATLPPERVDDARAAVGAGGLELTEIGYVTDGEGVSLRLPGGGELEPVGFDHRRGSRSGSAGSGSGSSGSG